MDFHLRVVAAFAEHAAGALITDAEKIAFALAHHPASVVRVAAAPALSEPAHPDNDTDKEGA